MSYNLLAEGDLDLFELSGLVEAHAPVELFPIPAEASAQDALGIALASRRADEASVQRLSDLIERLWSKNAAVWDLMAGVRIATAADLVELAQRILGA